MRNLIGVILTVLVLACIGAWLLGEKFVPAVEVARDSARARILKLINEEKLNLKSAEIALAKAEKASIVMRQSVARARVKTRRIEREIAACNRTIDKHRADLVALETRLTAGQKITLVSGRALSFQEARVRVNATAQRLDLAGQKIKFLKDFRDAHQHRLEQLEAVMEQFPVQVAQMRASCFLLKEKVAAAEDFAKWAEDLVDNDASGNVLERAQVALEEAHRTVDDRLMELDVLLESASNRQRIAEPTTDEEPDVDALISEIRSILNGTSGDLSISHVVISKDEN